MKTPADISSIAAPVIYHETSRHTRTSSGALIEQTSLINTKVNPKGSHEKIKKGALAEHPFQRYFRPLFQLGNLQHPTRIDEIGILDLVLVGFVDVLPLPRIIVVTVGDSPEAVPELLPVDYGIENIILLPSPPDTLSPSSSLPVSVSLSSPVPSFTPTLSLSAPVSW
jgi:hypothetical protein